MSSKSLDLTKLTIDDIFRAKEERRQRLAKLPFEDKIKIVKKLQTVTDAMKGERVVFDSFLKTNSDFAGELVEKWDRVGDWYAKRALEPPPHPFDKRPDIIAVTASGKKLGIELKSWLDREQIAEARREERIRYNILKAIGKQPPNETQHIGYVWLSPKQVRFEAQDASDFRQQVFGLIDRVDKNWSRPERDQDYWHDRSDFSGFPILEKYLNSVRLYPASRRRLSHRWILFPSPGGHYSPNDMRETLKHALLAHRNDERYKDLRWHVGLDEVYLLVHYDFKAFAYNTPFAAPGFGFKEAAEFASSVLDGDGGYFDRIFLFQFLWGREEAYRIF